MMLSTAGKIDSSWERAGLQPTLSLACVCLCDILPFSLLTVR